MAVAALCLCPDCVSYEVQLEHAIDTAPAHGNSRYVPGLRVALQEFRHLHHPGPVADFGVPQLDIAHEREAGQDCQQATP